MTKRPADRPSLISKSDQIANVIHTYKARGNVEPFELVKALALIVRSHKEFGEDDHALVPVDLLYAIASKLVGKRRALAEIRKRRTKATSEEHDRLRRFKLPAHRTLRVSEGVENLLG